MSNEIKDKANNEAVIIGNIACKKEGLGNFSSTEVYLLVEGTTDKEFIAKLDIRTDETLQLKCIPLGDVLYANKCIKDKYTKFFKDNRIDIKSVIHNAKKSVLNIVNEKASEGIMTFYGIVDKDFDTPQKIQKYHENIMVTPQHDLETLLLSTDDKIFDENIKEAFEISRHVAYLIGKVEKYLQDHGYIYRKLQDNDYRDIIPIQKRQLRLDDVMYLKDLTDFARLLDVLIDENNDDKSRIIREVSQNISNIEIDGYSDDDIYNIANGHDIANIMKLLCKEDIDRFVRSHNAGAHDRDVEFAIIIKYNISKFKGNPLYYAMKGKGFTSTAIK